MIDCSHTSMKEEARNVEMTPIARRTERCPVVPAQFRLILNQQSHDVIASMQSTFDQRRRLYAWNGPIIDLPI